MKNYYKKYKSNINNLKKYKLNQIYKINYKMMI